MQTAAILRENPDARIYTISSAAHQGLTELLRALVEEKKSRNEGSAEPKAASRQRIGGYDRDTASASPVTTGRRDLRLPKAALAEAGPGDVPIISLSDSAIKDSWTIEKTDDEKFIVHGDKIEKFARRTDFSNYAAINRLRDIMKKMGIRAELTSQGAVDDSIISIAGHEFTLVEDW